MTAAVTTARALAAAGLALKARAAVHARRAPALAKAVHEAQYEGAERDVGRVVRGLIDIQLATTAERLRGASTAEMENVFDPREWDRALVQAVAPPLATHMARAAAGQTALAARATQKASTAAEWLYEQPAVDPEQVVIQTPYGPVAYKIGTEYPQWLKDVIQERLEETFEQDYWMEINNTTGGDIDDYLRRAVVDGRSIENMAREIERMGGEGYSRRRGRVIARTEVGHALNGARSASIDYITEELGADMVRKVWLSVLGNTTRDTHANNDGVPAGPDGLWTLAGYKVRWPADIVLPPGERCSCQCSVNSEFGMSDELAWRLVEDAAARAAGKSKARAAVDGFRDLLGDAWGLLEKRLKGGPGSGDWGHSGRPGQVGGSGGGGGRGQGDWSPSMPRKEAEKWASSSKWTEDLYHVTGRGNVKPIEEGGFRTSNGTFGNGVYLSESGDVRAATGIAGDEPEAITVKVRVKNPLILDLRGPPSSWSRDYKTWTEIEGGGNGGDAGRQKLLAAGYDAVQVFFGTTNYRLILDPRSIVVVTKAVKGGPGSGNFNHQGRPGQVGGAGQGGSPLAEVYADIAARVPTTKDGPPLKEIGRWAVNAEVHDPPPPPEGKWYADLGSQERPSFEVEYTVGVGKYAQTQRAAPAFAGHAVYVQASTETKKNLELYTTPAGYKPMNTALREGGAALETEWGQKALDVSKFIMEKGHPIPPGLMLSRTHAEAPLDDLKPGTVVSDKAILSTSTRQDGVFNDNKVHWHITVGEGVRGLAAVEFSTAKHEKEVMIAPNQRIMVIKVEKDAEKIIDGVPQKKDIVHAIMLPTVDAQCCPP